jgi:ketosteroid isomerase-like protein
VRAKDIDGIMAYYAADLTVFNVKPLFRIQDRNDWRRVWEKSLSHFPASFGTETRELTIIVGGDLAMAHYLLRFTGLPGDPAWIRVTVLYRQVEGRWLIVHEHNSVPFDPETLRPVFRPES